MKFKSCQHDIQVSDKHQHFINKIPEPESGFYTVAIVFPPGGSVFSI